MDNGSIILNMDMYGAPTGDIEIFIPTDQRDTGHGQRIMAGSGFQIMSGDGHHSIMVAGSMTLTRDGYGFPITNGGRHG